MENKMPKIYIVAGKARNGKDTTCLLIKEEMEKKGLKVINLSYGSYIKEFAKKISNWDGNDETKPRTLLQQLGTDIIRKNIDEDFFIKRLCNDVKVYSYFFDVITISDARFKREIDIPRGTFPNVIAVNIERPNFDNGLTEEQRKHPSEIDLDDYANYDFKLENDGDVEDLRKKIVDMIGEK